MMASNEKEVRMETGHTLILDEAAKFISISPRSLADRRFRAKLGLPARKVGRKVVFLVSDLERLLERGKERFAGEGRR
jgi:hypothetical protein